ILQKVVDQDAPSPRLKDPNYPIDLELIVLKALARDRDQRYSTAEEFQVDLEAFAREHKLSVSALSLSRFIKQLFIHKVDAWRQAQEAGKSLAEHLSGNAPTPPGATDEGPTEAPTGISSHAGLAGSAPVATPTATPPTHRS